VVVALPTGHSVYTQKFNHLGIRPVYHMILIANMICDCRLFAMRIMWQTGWTPRWLIENQTKLADSQGRRYGSGRPTTWIGTRDATSWATYPWDKLLHTDDRHRKSVLMKASDVKPKRR